MAFYSTTSPLQLMETLSPAQPLPRNHQTAGVTSMPENSSRTFGDGQKPYIVYKCLLNQLVQKMRKPPPVYQTKNEGSDHLPRFRTTVWVDDVAYTSARTFQQLMTSEMDASRLAYSAITQQTKTSALQFIQQEKIFCKSVMVEFAAKNKNLGKLVYETTTLATSVPRFRSNLQFNGVIYQGDIGKSKKEAEQLVARSAIIQYLDSEFGADMADIVYCKLRQDEKDKAVETNSMQSGSIKPVAVESLVLIPSTVVNNSCTPVVSTMVKTPTTTNIQTYARRGTFSRAEMPPPKMEYQSQIMGSIRPVYTQPQLHNNVIVAPEQVSLPESRVPTQQLIYPEPAHSDTVAQDRKESPISKVSDANPVYQCVKFEDTTSIMQPNRVPASDPAIQVSAPYGVLVQQSMVPTQSNQEPVVPQGPPASRSPTSFASSSSELSKGGKQGSRTTSGESEPAPNISQVSPTRLLEASDDAMPRKRMRGSLSSNQLQAARLQYLAPPQQPARANEPWSRPPVLSLRLPVMMPKPPTNSDHV